MSEALLRTDREARERAGDARASVLLEAPAGSGKTAVLTERYLRLLTTVEEPGEILAITFTRKAAAEMRARVTRALAGPLPADDPASPRLRALAEAVHAHGAARGWRVLEEPEALRIQTIDAFNFALASQLPVAARAGGALTVTETPQGLYRRAARATLLGAEGEAALAADVNLLFERLDNHWGRFEGLLALMLRQRAQWLRHVLGAGEGQLERDVNASLETLTRARLAEALRVVPAPLRQDAAALPGVGTLGAQPADLPRWQRLAALTLRHDGQWRAQLGAGVLKDPAFADPARCRELRDLIEALRRTAGARELLAGIARAPAAGLAAADEEAIGALARVLARAAAELQAEFALAGEVDYTYVAGAARAALSEAGEPTELALRTGLKLRHILVDEFQDTSLAQIELLRTLTATWEPGDGRTLFVVGDPMQSIYRFRDAEVGLFLAARSGGIGRVALEPLRLTRNFRARADLVQFCNELFGPLFPAADEVRSGAVRYSASLPARAAAPPAEAALTLRLFPADARAEARALAARARELRARDPTARIAVLVAAHAHATAIVEALTEAGVGSLGVDLVPLAERAVVRDLVQLARALLDLGDRNAWLAVLRAPWCGATLATLATLSSPEDAQLPYEALADPARLARLPPAERARLERVRTVLAASLAARERTAVADWLEAVWVRLGASDAYPREALEDARAFFAALAVSAADGRWRGAEDFGPLLEGLYSASQAPEANPLQIMTIHRAKGLEFEHVLVPALERPLAHDERWLLRPIELADESGRSELLVAPAPPVGAEPSALDDYVRDLLRERTAHERLRLLYVAVTRARETLWLSGAPKADAAGELRPDARSLLARLWPVLGPRFERVPGQGGGAEQARVAPLRRLCADWQPPALEAGLPLATLPLAPLSLEPPEFSWVGETARHVGTLVHEWLARLARQPALPGPAELAAEREALMAALARQAVPTAERAQAAEQVLEALRASLADERGRWILSGEHREAHAELALTGVAEGRLRTLVIDRSFIDEAGTRWVIDFKTSRHEGGGREAFLDSELERYQGQLRAYAALARELGPEPVRAALYFPLLRAFRELGL
jgi:ATP-dependent exoDNAse (exonuclease V) beta subunit